MRWSATGSIRPRGRLRAKADTPPPAAGLACRAPALQKAARHTTQRIGVQDHPTQGQPAPAAPPARDAGKKGAPATPPRPSLGHVLISSVRNEGPYMLEFVAHHRAIGFDLICIASNDCTDGTDLVLDALDRAGAIRHLPNVVAPGEVPQHAGYAAMRARFGLDDADWLMVLDADEFLHVTAGAGRVADLTAAVPDGTDIIMLNPQTFGTSADPAWHPGLVTQQFQRRLPQRHQANRPVKTLARGLSRFREINNHSVMSYRGKAPLNVVRSDLSGFEIPPGVGLWRHLRNIPVDQIRHGLAHYNHYAIKSLASFCLRQARGRGATPLDMENDRHTMPYFDKIAAARIRDTGFADRYGPALRAEMDRLLSLPGVADAQAETERRYGALIAALMD